MRSAVIIMSGSLLVAGVAAAQDASAPVVRIEASPETVTVGQPLQLRVTVLAPTWFPKPPVFPSFELPNAIIRLPPNSAYPTSERVGGESWSGVVRDYIVYPQLAARYQLTDLSVRVTYADPATRKPVVADVPVPDVVFGGVKPKGAEDLDPFLPGTSLTLEQTIDGNADELAVGDAIVRQVTATIGGTPAMFLPPLIGDVRTAGLSAYPKEPHVSETPGARGGALTGTRSESVTYVLDSAGQYSLPAISLRWWNTKSKAVEAVSVPAVPLTVVGGLGDSAPDMAPAKRSSDPYVRIIAIAGVGLLLLALVITRYGRSLTAWGRVCRRAWQASETFAYRQLLRSIGHGNPHIIYRQLMVWLERLEPGLTVDRLSALFGEADFAAHVRELSSGLFGRASEGTRLTKANKKALKVLLARVRRTMRRRAGESRRPAALPPLNPRHPAPASGR